jgi:chromosome segregation ATPase
VKGEIVREMTSRQVEKKRSGTKPGGKHKDTDKIEDKLLDIYGGRDAGNLPTTLMFDHVSPATRLLEKRRQMFEVQEALNSQKDEFNRREDAYRRREDGLRRKDLELQESLIKFNKFLQENESKRYRAQRRAAEERKQQDAKDVEIRKLEDQLHDKLLEESKLKDEVEKNLQYQDFLENMCQTMSKYFPEISDILGRYKTLKDANQQLLEQKQGDDEEVDARTKEFSAFKKDKENQILNQNNEIAELQMQMEQTIASTADIKANIDREKTEKSTREVTLGSILSASSNILDRCEQNFRARHNKPQREKSPERPEDADLGFVVDKCMAKLDEISMFMVDFVEVKKEYAQIKASQSYGYGATSDVGLAGGSRSIYSH